MKKHPVKAATRESDERVRRSKQAVLTTTYQLLSEAGLSGVSVDAVAKRSGVAKTTIYRHWPSRSALLLDACSNMTSKPEAPDTGNFKGDLELLIKFYGNHLRSSPSATVVPSIIDAAERDRDLAKVQTSIVSQMSSSLRTVTERAQQKSELPRDLDPSYVIAAVLGPLFFRRWFSREPIDDAFAKAIVKNVTRNLS